MSTMHRTLTVPRLAGLSVLCACGVLCCGSLAAQQREPANKIVDLTLPLPPPRGRSSMPGARFGGIAGLPRNPGYALPLEATIQSVSPLTAAPGARVVVELLVRNTGSVRYYLPVSRNDATIHEAGNRGRRRFMIDVRVRSSQGQGALDTGVATTSSADTAPESLATVKPGETVMIRFFVGVRDLGGNPALQPREVSFGIVLSEWSSEDDQYVIKDRSERVASKNQVKVTVLPQ